MHRAFSHSLIRPFSFDICYILMLQTRASSKAMSKHHVSPASLTAPERHARSRLHQLLSKAEGFLHGSLIVMARRCGKPSCRCASDDGARHHSLCLGQTREGKTATVHIPADLEPLVRHWVDNFQQASGLLEQLSQEGRGRLAKAKARKPAGAAGPTASRKPAKPKPPRKPS